MAHRALGKVPGGGASRASACEEGGDGKSFPELES